MGAPALGPAGVSGAQAAVALLDANNDAIAPTLPALVVEVGALTDGEVDFSALNADVLGLPLEPSADLDAVALAHFPGREPTAVAQALSTNRLVGSDVGRYGSVETGGADAIHLSSLDLLGTPFVPDERPSGISPLPRG